MAESGYSTTVHDTMEVGKMEEMVEGNKEVVCTTAILPERRNKRISTGDYPKKPKEGEPKLGVVHFRGKHIIETRYKKTLKAITRAFWHDASVDHGREAYHAFLDHVLTEFRKYYNYEEGVEDEKGDKLVAEHIKENFNQILYEDMERTDKLVRANPGTSRRKFKPRYFNKSTWKSFCKWWDQMEKNNSKNRKSKCLQGKPFPLFRDDGLDRMWDEYTQDFCASNRTPNSPSKHRKLDDKMPMMETDEPKKNRILTEPHVSVTEEDCGTDMSTARSHPYNASHSLGHFPYHLIPIVLKDVSNLAFTMEGMEIVTREHLDNELLKLDTIPVPDQDDPMSQVERDNYIKLARTLGPQLFKMHKERRNLTGQTLQWSDYEGKH